MQITENIARKALTITGEECHADFCGVAGNEQPVTESTTGVHACAWKIIHYTE